MFLKNFFLKIFIYQKNRKELFVPANLGLADMSLPRELRRSFKKRFLSLKNFDAQDKWDIASRIRSIGNIFEKQGSIAYAAGDKINSKNKFNESLNKYLSAIQLFEEAKLSHFTIAGTYIDIGKILIKLKDLPKAKFYLEKSFHFFKENKG